MSEKKMTSIGGQAILEGVMMRGPHKMAMAVRKANGEIVIEEKDVKKHPIVTKIPLVRGVFSFFSSLIIGIQAINFSAKFFDLTEEEKAELAKKEAEKEAKNKNKKKSKLKELDKKEEGEFPMWAMFVAVAGALALSIGLFVLLPNFFANHLVAEKEENALLYNICESIIKLCVFFGYIIGVSQMKDMKRLFQYHGAEHKTIFCYENGDELTVENVKKYRKNIKEKQDALMKKHMESQTKSSYSALVDDEEVPF